MSQGRREVNRAAALQQYTLQGVRETGVELGRGSYAAVYTVEYKGLKCAAKIFHPTLYPQQEYAIGRFREECAILSRVKHPNIVQFLGVYHQPGSMLPALVMECLPMTLDWCIEQYGVLPNEIGYSILNDIAYALSYLHQHNPPIIHRDLTATNVLLTRGMTAKISDLGMAKHLFPTSLNKKMTETPGNPYYMPPETMQTNPRYGSKVDVFSFGVLMVYLFSGELPTPTAATMVDPQDESRMIPQSEADRRQEKLDAIGGDHPLMTLILRCLHNSPARRPEAVEILTQVSRVAAQFPPSSQNKVEMLRQVASLRADTERLQREHEAEIQSLRANTQRLQQEHEEEITSMRADAERLQRQHEAGIWSLRARLQQHEAEITTMRAVAERLQRKHQTEIIYLRVSSLAELESTRRTLQAEIRSAQTQQREAEKAAEESQRKLEDAERCHSVEVEQLNLWLVDTRDTLSSRVVEVEAEAQQLISSKSSALLILLTEKEQRLSQLTQQKTEIETKLHSKEAILSSKESLVASKDSIIGGLQEQLDHLRKSHTAQVIASLQANIGVLNEQVNHLSSTYLPKEVNLFPNGAKLKWKKSKDMPSGMTCAQTVLISGKVYVSEGYSWSDDDAYLIQQYNQTEEEWSALPPTPVCLFGMGELNGQLVIVGGVTRQDVVIGKVQTFDTSSQKWEESIPPMPTARYSPAVFSQPSCLTVVGGVDQHDKDLSNVEIFIPQTSQWHNAYPAPSPLSCMTKTIIHNKCFLAEYIDSAKVYQFCASVHLATTTGSSVAPQVTTEWKDLPELQYQCFALGSLNGCLLAVGGGGWDNPISTVQSYSPITDTWERVGDLPNKCHYCSTVLLPTTGELLVMGGMGMGAGGAFYSKEVWRATVT